MIQRCLLVLGAVISTAVMARCESRFDVRVYGATGDGVALETASVQRAIDKAHANGGGMVTVPAGTYRIGTLILKDHVELHLESGATLLGSPDIRDYARVDQRFPSRTNGLYAKYFMIFAEGASDISITGPGTIHGNGLNNFQTGDPQNMRPFMIRLVQCKNITLRDLHLLEAANWTLHLLGCRDVTIDGIVIETGADANRDGLDIDCCQRVSVSNARFSTGDDAIVLKATSDVTCQDIAITNCLIRTRASAIKTGTESNGGFRNITVSNCVIKSVPVHAGIELMTVDGGTLQNVLIENVAMDSVATPFFIRVGIRARPYTAGQYVNRIEDARDISLRDISVTNAKLPSSIMGLHDRTIKNVTVSGYTVRSVERQKATPYNQVPFEEFSYPAARVFKNLPAFGIYCRNVEELLLHDIAMYSASGERRPALTLDRVMGADLLSVRGHCSDHTAPLVHVRNSRDIQAGRCRTLNATDALFEIEEGTCGNVRTGDNMVRGGQQEVLAVKALPDAGAFEDFKTDVHFAVDSGVTIQGLAAHDLGKAPLKVNLEMSKKGTLQLCLLVLNEGPTPEHVHLSYEGISQEFRIDWNEWGWAPITLLKEYDTPRVVEFDIQGAGPHSQLRIARVSLRYQDLGHTD
jgi:hypothetical protein